MSKNLSYLIVNYAVYYGARILLGASQIHIMTLSAFWSSDLASRWERIQVVENSLVTPHVDTEESKLF